MSRKSGLFTLSMFSAVALLSIIVAESALGCGYTPQTPTDVLTPTTTPANINTGSEGWDHKGITYATHTATSNSITAHMGVYDTLPGTDSDTLGSGEAVLMLKGERTQTWQWCGDGSQAPGCNFDVLFSGSGAVGANGSATGGGVASASGSGSSQGSGTAHGFNVSASNNNVGGSCTITTTGSQSGSAQVSPTGVGMSSSVSSETQGTGTFTQTSQWQISKSSNRSIGTGSSTITVYTQNQVTISGTCTVDGAYAHIQIDTCTSAMSGSVSNIVLH